MESNAVRSHGSQPDDPFTQSAIGEAGFSGFVSFCKLREDGINDVPRVRGIYVVLRDDENEPVFLERSVGGWFKGQDPTVDISILQAKWVDGVDCIYIGKANELRRRLREYMRFGAGRPIGHRGGRYIWQVDRSDNLIVAWKETPVTSPRQAESEMLLAFGTAHGGRLPFANLVA